MSLFESMVRPAGSAEIPVLLIVSFLKVAIFVGLALLVRNFMSDAHPDRRHLLMRLALAISVLLPVTSFAFSIFNSRLISAISTTIFLSVPGLIATSSAGDRLPSSAVADFPWMGLAVVIWLAGASAVLLRLGYGLILRSKLLRQSQPFDTDDGQQLAQQLTQELGIKRRIRLAISSAISGPVAWSLPRATVILPSESLTWSRDELRVALVHEFSHIKRRDDVWMLMGVLATAIHWFNPLVWLTKGKLILDADSACDSMVVNSGSDGNMYARFMLAMARRCSMTKISIAIGSEIFGRKQLEERIMAIQNGSVRSHQVRRSLVGLAWILSLSISIPVAGARIAGNTDAADNAQKTETAKPAQFPAPDSFVDVSEQPVMLHAENPAYPDSAKKAGIEGSVWVQVLVDTAGHAADVRIKQTSNFEPFDKSALAAAKKTAWKPAEFEGRKVAVWVVYQIKFTLGDKTAKPGK